MNRVSLEGKLARDPETRSFSNGGSVVGLRVETVETWQQGGETKTRSEWHNVDVWAERAQQALHAAKKGDTVSVEGKLETRKWTDQSGATRYSTSVVVRPAPGHGVAVLHSDAPPPAAKSAQASSTADDDLASFAF